MKNGGPAFPAKNYIVPNDLEARYVRELGATQGMSMRDYFAAMALQGWFAQENEALPGNTTFEENQARVCALLYGWADAMIAARDKSAV